mmetsp:Transcript_25326/g.63688  ORF Transcript_25326/g.63688 Transcript_25326/m.63688 type:complete len:201 (+) Transcript_25326:450-1052(+)
MNSSRASLLPIRSQPLSSVSVTSSNSKLSGASRPLQATKPAMTRVLTRMPFAPIAWTGALLSMSLGRQIESGSPPGPPSVFQTRVKFFCGFHRSLKRASGFQLKASGSSFTGAAPTRFSDWQGRAIISKSLSNSTAALNSSALILRSRSSSMNSKTALIICGHLAVSLATLCSPKDSKPAASSERLMYPLPFESKAWKAS